MSQFPVPQLSSRVSFFAAMILLCATALAAESSKPAFLWSQYFNAKGENRYTLKGNYSHAMDGLKSDFDVRVNDAPLTSESLRGVSVVLISNPNDKAHGNNPPPHHMSADDVAELTRFVKAGGGLIVMGNQEGHNLEITDFNALLTQFGMKFVNNYTDAKQLIIPKDVPVLGGLRWAYYTGNQVVFDANNVSNARPLVLNDLKQKALGGPRDAEGTLLGIAEPGKGHVAVVTDAGWITNDAMSGKGIGKVSIKDQDNLEIWIRLTKWTAGLK